MRRLAQKTVKDQPAIALADDCGGACQVGGFGE
jgi:hypothetical protein